MERIDEEGRLARAVFWGLLAVVALAPLPFGANRPLPWSLLALSVGVLLVLWAVAALRAPGLVRVPIRRIAIPAVLYGMAMVWFLIQAAAWTPAAWHHPLYTQAALALGVPVPGAIALAPEAAQAAVMRLFAYGGIFWLALHYAHDPVRARQILWALALAGTGYAIYGLIIYLGDFQTILWYRKWAYWDALTSTFVNRNSYATYAGLGLVAVLALILRDLEISAPQGLSSRSALLHFVDHVRLSTFILVAAFLVIATALLLTQSRGGLASTLFAGVVLVGARGFSRNRRSTSRFSMSGIALALVAIVLISYSGERTLARFASTERGTSGRAEVYALTVEAIRERPILGTGLDSFPDVFSMRRDDRFPSSLTSFDKAHSTYLELALEGGLPALAALLGVGGWLVYRALIGVIRRRRDAIYPCAGLAATALVGTHTAFDFSLQIPAVAATYVMLTAVAVAQSWVHDRRNSVDPKKDQADQSVRL